MTNSEMENESKASDGVKETPNQVFSIKSHISKLANKALAEEKKDFNFKILDYYWQLGGWIIGMIHFLNFLLHYRSQNFILRLF